MKKKIYIFLFDGFSDWEIAYLTPEIQKSKEFEIIYFTQNGKPVVSMGGMQVLPNISMKEINLNELELLILPGGQAWEKSENNFMDSMVRNLFESGKTIAAICAATIYLARKGFLDKLKHTSNDLNYLKAMAPEYLGESNYINSLAITDQNIITANGIAPIEFASEIFKKLNLYEVEKIESWFQLFKNGIWTGN